MIKTRYPLFDTDYMLGYVPWDLHALNLPYHAHFSRADWAEGAKLCAHNRVNATRFFLSTGGAGSDAGNRYIPYYRRTNGKYNLLRFGQDMEEIEWRLEKFWERDITTFIVVASGIKGVADRFQQSVWHGDNNVNGTTTDHKYFMTNLKTGRIYDKVVTNLWDRWKDKPVVFGFINEPKFNNLTMYLWYSKRMNHCLDLGIPPCQFAFEKWDSGYCYTLLKKYRCWMLIHGVNHIGWFKKWHKRGRSLQKDFFVPFKYVACDSDGHDSEFPGEGLVGKLWNPNFRRAAPGHMWRGIIHDYKHSGGGCMWMSAGAYYKHPIPDRPHYDDWRHVAIDGLSKEECKEWGVDWKLFSYRKLFKRYPLGELQAIRKAARILE